MHFPIKRGFLRRTIGAVKAVDGVSLKLRAGPDDRRRRRIGLRQDDARPRAAAAHPLARPDRLSRPAHRRPVFKAMRPLRRDMQIVFQDPYGSLSPRLSVAEIVAEGLTVQAHASASRERREIVARALADTGLDPAAMDRYPHEFSGGQRQRIAIARAMVLEPKIRRARRADLGARHVGAGADRRSAAAIAGADATSPISSSATICASCARWPTRSSSCATARLWSRGRRRRFLPIRRAIIRARSSPLLSRSKRTAAESSRNSASLRAKRSNPDLFFGSGLLRRCAPRNDVQALVNLNPKCLAMRWSSEIRPGPRVMTSRKQVAQTPCVGQASG